MNKPLNPPISVDDLKFWSHVARRGLRGQFRQGLDFLHTNGLKLSDWAEAVEEELLEHGRLSWLLDLPEHPAGWAGRPPEGRLWVKMVSRMGEASGPQRAAWGDALKKWLALPLTDEGRSGLVVDTWLGPEIKEWTPVLLDSLRSLGSKPLPVRDGNWSVLLWAVACGQSTAVEHLLASGHSPLWRDPAGITPYHLLVNHFAKSFESSPCPTPSQTVALSSHMEKLLLSVAPAPTEKLMNGSTLTQYWEQALEKYMSRYCTSFSPTSKNWWEEVALLWEHRHHEKHHTPARPRI